MDENNPQLIFASPFDNNGDMWGTILEKGWSKVKGSYANSDGGYTETGLRSLIGAPSIWITNITADDIETTWKHNPTGGTIRIRDVSGNAMVGINKPIPEHTLDVNGNAIVHSLIQHSDSRFKKNIAPADLEYCSQVVRSIDLYKYEYILPRTGYSGTKAGFIAQQVQDIDSESVLTGHSVDPFVYEMRNCKILENDIVKIDGDVLPDGKYQFRHSENHAKLDMEVFTLKNNIIVDSISVKPIELGNSVFIIGMYRNDMLQLSKQQLNQYLFGAVKELMSSVDKLTKRVEELESKQS